MKNVYRTLKLVSKNRQLCDRCKREVETHLFKIEDRFAMGLLGICGVTLAVVMISVAGMVVSTWVR